MAPKVDHRPVRLADGRFRLITTTTTVHVVERVVDEAYLRRLGIPVPPPADVPWAEPQPAPVPARRPSIPELMAEQPAPYATAMSYWRERGFSIDRRMVNHVPAWLDAFGLEAVLRAMHQVATVSGHGPPYMRLVREIRRLRGELDGQGGPGP